MPAKTPGSRAVMSALPDRSPSMRMSVVGSPILTSSARAESMMFRISGVISNVVLVRKMKPIPCCREWALLVFDWLSEPACLYHCQHAVKRDSRLSRRVFLDLDPVHHDAFVEAVQDP